MMKKDRRNYVTITKTKEQAEFERNNPYIMYECPECGKVLPVVPKDYKHNKAMILGKECISLYSKETKSVWCDFWYEMLSWYYNKMFVDEYHCKSCGAEWKTEPYVCNVEETSMIEAKKQLINGGS